MANNNTQVIHNQGNSNLMEELLNSLLMVDNNLFKQDNNLPPTCNPASNLLHINQDIKCPLLVNFNSNLVNNTQANNLLNTKLQANVRIFKHV